MLNIMPMHGRSQRRDKLQIISHLADRRGLVVVAVIAAILVILSTAAPTAAARGGRLGLLLLPPTTTAPAARACVLRHRPRLPDEVDIGGAPDVPLEHGDELGQDVAVDPGPAGEGRAGVGRGRPALAVVRRGRAGEDGVGRLGVGPAERICGRR